MDVTPALAVEVRTLCARGATPEALADVFGLTEAQVADILDGVLQPGAGGLLRPLHRIGCGLSGLRNSNEIAFVASCIDMARQSLSESEFKVFCRENAIETPPTPKEVVDDKRRKRRILRVHAKTRKTLNAVIWSIRDDMDFVV